MFGYKHPLFFNIFFHIQAVIEQDPMGLPRTGPSLIFLPSTQIILSDAQFLSCFEDVKPSNQMEGVTYLMTMST